MAYHVPPVKKVGGLVPRVPHQISPMLVAKHTNLQLDKNALAVSGTFLLMEIILPTGNILPTDGSQIVMKSLPFSFCACINNSVSCSLAFNYS